MSLKHWISAFRLRTLPLALSSTAMGSFMAWEKDIFSWQVFVLAMLTTLLLQILSNLANDLGDTQHGVDNENRLGPVRATQSGSISLIQMKWMIAFFTVLSFVSGIWLLVVGFKGIVFSGTFIAMLALGILAILAALKYTMGRNPYGYAGLGDLFVFLFFGLTGVLGTVFLHGHQLHVFDFLPAISIGVFSTAVLNLNNLRDADNDKANGKHTLVARFGELFGRMYHLCLILIGLGTAVVYLMLQKNITGFIWCAIPVVLFGCITVGIFREKTPEYYNKSLRNLSLTIFVFTLLYGIGLIS